MEELRVLQAVADTDEPIVIRLRHEPHAAAQQLLVALGAGWIIDPHAEPCVRSCGRRECTVNAVARDGEQIVVEIIDGVADTSHVHMPDSAQPRFVNTARTLCGTSGTVYAKGGPFAASPWCDQCLDLVPTSDRRRASMSVVETRTCKVEGCDNAAHDATGRYARLCLTHKSDARAAAAAALRDVAPRSAPTGDGYTARVRALIAPAKSLDQARRKLDQAGTNEQLQNEFAEASRRATAVPNAENLARLEAASKALRQEAPRAEKARHAYADAERKFKLALADIARDFRAAA